MKKLLLIIALFVTVAITASAITGPSADGKRKEKKENTTASEKKATVKEDGACCKTKECPSKEKKACCDKKK
ncbi:MAG: hypothetical protein RBS73_17430 [Prolixibacteraceae bacterium]|jgi:maltose-binding protein MalE|nr:hypothetical protein [Prolixibacteraceae bacterium]